MTGFAQFAVTPIVGYLVDVETRERFQMQYNPSEIADTKETTYASIVVPGMSHPRYQFVAGGARRITFTLHLLHTDTTGKTVSQRCHWLRSLQYPEHTGKMLTQAPHRVLLFFGQLYPGVECMVREAKIQYHSQFDPATLLPLRATVELTLEEFVRTSVNASTVRKGGVQR